MSAADGDMDARENKYLQLIANRLEIVPQHLAVIEASFSCQKVSDLDALAEVHSLLDSARFYELDTIFIKAASDLLSVLPSKVEQGKSQKQNFSIYEQLAKFQTHRQQLDNLCFQTYNTIKDCAIKDFYPIQL